MKYLADDGTVFESEQACLDHENIESRRDVVRQEVKHWLSLTDKSEKAQAVALGHIMQWLEYDLRQRPERYDVPVPPPVANVEPIKESA